MQEAVNQDGGYLIHKQSWRFNWTTVLAQVQILGESDLFIALSSPPTAEVLLLRRTG